MAEHTELCTILRDGNYQSLLSSEIVPGDLIVLKTGQNVPCDGVLISGSCVMDEAMLTGESMPVQKTPIRSGDQPYCRTTSGKKHSLFAGTTVLQAQAYEGEDQVLKKFVPFQIT